MSQNQKAKTSWMKELGEVMLAIAVAWVAYQGLTVVTGTSLPIVAVVSDSMYHDSSFNSWWPEHPFYQSIGINRTEFSHFPFPNGLSKGDLIFVVNEKPNPGDVVIYQRDSIVIIHRVVQARKNGYVIRGDNNPMSDENGAPISSSRIKGRAVAAIPLLGYPRTIIYDIFKI